MKVVRHWNMLRRVSCECPLPGSVQARLDRAQPEQPDPVEDTPAHCSWVGLDDLQSLSDPPTYFVIP